MERTCARAVALGLRALAFTEHADYVTWIGFADHLDQYQQLRASVRPDGTVTPSRLDVDGYLECVERCRVRFPQLRIMTGVELGEPHWHRDAVATLLDAGRFDRTLGSLHCLAVDRQLAELPYVYQQHAAADVMRDYLAEVARLIARSDAFVVLAHVDYAARYWPDSAGPFDANVFEAEFRYALRVLADSGRALEVNTQGPLRPEIVRWWRDEGGRLVSFGSDTHDPTGLAYGFTEATAMVEAHGFRPGRDPHDLWTRSDGTITN